MEVAEARLAVPRIISAEEMANPNIPELAVMAYIVQFRKVSEMYCVLNLWSNLYPGLAYIWGFRVSQIRF